MSAIVTLPCVAVPNISSSVRSRHASEQPTFAAAAGEFLLTAACQCFEGDRALAQYCPLLTLEVPAANEKNTVCENPRPWLRVHRLRRCESAALVFGVTQSSMLLAATGRCCSVERAQRV